jgi:hypothetical protein
MKWRDVALRVNRRAMSNSTLARDVSVSILDELPPVQLEQVPSGAGFRFRNDDQAPSELRQTFEIARFDN